MRAALIALLGLGCGQAPATPPPDAHEELDALDARTPVPMPPHMALHQKEQMRDHLEAMQAVAAALADGDWDGVEAAGVRLGTGSASAGTCEHMGARADGFTAQAEDFHRRADAIAAAARTRDEAAVLRATADTLAACTACHATWRQQLVSD